MPNTSNASGFFTKPLQGKQLKVLRDVIMGEKNSHSLHILNDSALKERIGKDVNHIMRGQKYKMMTYAQIVTGKISQSTNTNRVRFENTH